MLELIQHGNVVELRMTDAENDNTLTPEGLIKWHLALDAIEANTDNSAMLISSSSDKTFSTGINLPWVGQQTADSFMAFVADFDKLLLRLATFCMPTIGILNGNTYAGGALIAAALDFRFMRAERGRFCFAEVNIKVPFSLPMMAVVKLLPSQQGAYELAITGAAWNANECVEQGVVDQAVPLENLFEAAHLKAQSVAGKHRATFTTIKRDFRSSVTAMAIEQGIIPERSNAAVEPPRL